MSRCAIKRDNYDCIRKYDINRLLACAHPPPGVRDTATRRFDPQLALSKTQTPRMRIVTRITATADAVPNNAPLRVNFVNLTSPKISTEPRKWITFERGPTKLAESYTLCSLLFRTVV